MASELIVKRSWSAGAVADPRPKDLTERLVVVRDGKRVSVQNQEIWQDFIRAAIPPGITQFFFFDGEKIQEIAADDHSEVRLKSSLEAALGIQNINRLASDLAYIKQEERKGFVEISDEDLEFKQSELKKEKSKLTRKNKERVDLQDELEGFREQLAEAKKRFEATFQSEPETREAMREQEKRRIQASNRLTQVENEIRHCARSRFPLPWRESCSTVFASRSTRSGSRRPERRSRKTPPSWPSDWCGWSKSRNQFTGKSSRRKRWWSWNAALSACSRRATVEAM